MDNRFPALLRSILRKLDFLALPGLGKFIVAATVVAFVAKNILGVPADRFVFDPQLVLDGELWRLIVFPSQGIDNPLWLLFFILYIFFVFNSLEAVWGSGPLTVFTLFSYIMAILGAFVIGQPVPVWFYVVENVSLAFWTLFPELELYIYFILPVKAKWLALLAGVAICFQFLLAGLTGKILFAMVLSPYLLFFSPMLLAMIRRRRRPKEQQHRDSDWR